MTIAIPASKASPTSTLDSACWRIRPSPGAPMSAVMTTIDRASMIVWLMASPIGRRASGSVTLRSSWPSVAPSERAASTVVDDTPRIPRAVIRIAAGMAKIKVATVDGATPIRNSSVIGVR